MARTEIRPPLGVNLTIFTIITSFLIAAQSSEKAFSKSWSEKVKLGEE